jgi:hypothetical protein
MLKYIGLNGKCLNAETEIKISLYTENFHSLNGNIFVYRDFEAETNVKYSGLNGN